MNGPANLPNPFVGAWELVSGFYVGEGDAIIRYEDEEVKSLKVLSESRFSFVTSAKGEFYAAGGGEYMAGKGVYVELPALASHSAMIGQRYEFQYQLAGDTWTNTRWQAGVQVELEVWKRVQSR